MLTRHKQLKYVVFFIVLASGCNLQIPDDVARKFSREFVKSIEDDATLDLIVDSFIEGLSDQSLEPEQRAFAAECLGEIDCGSNTVRALSAALSDQQPLVRAAAVRALGRVGNRAIAAVPALIELVNDGMSSPDLRIAAAEALGEIGPSEEAIASLQQLKSEMQLNKQIDVNGYIKIEATLRKIRAYGPQWFFRMDRDRDGQLKIQEFLGTTEQFEQVDTNCDGAIDSTEAQQLHTQR